MTTRITRILVPVDFSPQSEEAVRYAAGLAKDVNAGLDIVHVIEDPFMSAAWGPEVYVPNIMELLESLTANAVSRLEQLKTTVAAGLPTETDVLRGEPSRAIVEHAKNSGADLIVMGTHGRTGLSHVVLGSVAERVVRHAHCPVLTVRGAAPAAEQHTAAVKAA